MTGLAQSLYDRSPTAMRSAMASAYGFYLRHLRYGRETEKLVHEALDRDYWPAERWAEWQARRRTQILTVAANATSHYRAIWNSDQPAGGRERGDVLGSLAELTRYYQDHGDDAKALLSVGASPADAALDPAIVAAWTMTANELLNLDEVLNK